MSKLEERIQSELKRNQINFEIHKPIPIGDYPWKTNRSMTSPKCDIYLNDFDIFIEIKGFMTFQAVSKLSFLSRQDFKYYIFQGTELEWNPFINTNISTDNYSIKLRNNARLESNIKHQLNELINLKKDSDFYRRISLITLSRLKQYISVKIDEYQNWNGEWY
jgi:hypothetical protein